MGNFTIFIVANLLNLRILCDREHTQTLTHSERKRERERERERERG